MKHSEWVALEKKKHLLPSHFEGYNFCVGTIDFDRWARYGVEWEELYSSECGAVIRSSWGGRRRNTDFYFYPVTKLIQCQWCERWSTPKKVQYRNGCHAWNLESYHDCHTEPKSMLCMGCWNKVRRVVEAQNLVDENKRLINKMKREMLKWQKSQQQAI